MMMTKLSRFLFSTLRGRLIVSVALVHAIMMALFIVDLTARQRAMLLERQVEEATALSRTLAVSAAGWIAADDIAGLLELVEAQKRYPELLFAMLIDEQGRVLADTDTRRSGLYLQDLPRDSRQAVLSQNPALVDVAVPAMIGARHVGWARVGIGQKEGSRKLAEITRNGVFYALAAILVGSVVAWFMGLRITKRLYCVQQTIDAVSSGDRTARSSISGDDEAAVMASEFNSMLDTLAEKDMNLRASEERYRSLIFKVQAAIVLHDGQGRILAGNPMARRLLGLSENQLLGKDLIDPAWHFLREDGSVLPPAEYPVSQVLTTRHSIKDCIIGIRRPDCDEVAWMLVNAEPEYDDSGEIVQTIVSFVEITRRKHAEEELHVKTVELEEEVAERQMAQENLQDKALLLEDEIEKRQKAQDELEQLNETLEQRIQERTAELEAKNADLQKMNKLFVGRELRMVELKERIRELEGKTVDK
ncbi:MAG: PAS domain S-box protein [Desulfuromonadaceae bacterium]|nr:PAS domain S-box protein [Desulfuromonadaceae bacterium]